MEMLVTKRYTPFGSEREFLRASGIRKGPKRHSVNRERSHLEKAKHLQRKKAQGAKILKVRAYLEAVRAYWRGDTPCHPASPF